MSQNRELVMPRIEIERVIPSWVTSECAGMRWIHVNEIAKPVFHVNVFEDGGEFILWSGKSYEEAIIVAEEAARDWPARIFDLVAIRNN